MLTTIPLPAGKRIVIESISVNATVPIGAKPIGWVMVGANGAGVGSGSSGLQFSEQGQLSGQSYFVGVSPTKIRFNTDQHTLQVNVYRVNSSGAYSFNVSVFGYIENL